MSRRLIAALASLIPLAFAASASAQLPGQQIHLEDPAEHRCARIANFAPDCSQGLPGVPITPPGRPMDPPEAYASHAIGGLFGSTDPYALYGTPYEEALHFIIDPVNTSGGVVAWDYRIAANMPCPNGDLGQVRADGRLDPSAGEIGYEGAGAVGGGPIATVNIIADRENLDTECDLGLAQNTIVLNASLTARFLKQYRQVEGADGYNYLVLQFEGSRTNSATIKWLDGGLATFTPDDPLSLNESAITTQVTVDDRV